MINLKLIKANFKSIHHYKIRYHSLYKIKIIKIVSKKIVLKSQVQQGCNSTAKQVTIKFKQMTSINYLRMESMVMMMRIMTINLTIIMMMTWLTFNTTTKKGDKM